MVRIIVRRRIPPKVIGGEVVEPNGLTLGSTTIDHQFYEHVPIPDSHQTGLNATSTGVKWTSRFKFKWYKTLLKTVTIRASWSASATDSVEKICVKDIQSGKDVVCLQGNNGSDQEESTDDLSNITDGGLWQVYSAVVKASSTSGAKYSIDYVVVELTYEYRTDNIAQWQ